MNRGYMDIKVLIMVNGVLHDAATLYRLTYCQNCGGHTEHGTPDGELCSVCSTDRGGK